MWNGKPEIKREVVLKQDMARRLVVLSWKGDVDEQVAQEDEATLTEDWLTKTWAMRRMKRLDKMQGTAEEKR